MAYLRVRNLGKRAALKLISGTMRPTTGAFEARRRIAATRYDFGQPNIGLFQPCA